MTKPDAEKLVDDFEDAVIEAAFEAAGASGEKKADAEYERIRAELIAKLTGAAP